MENKQKDQQIRRERACMIGPELLIRRKMNSMFAIKYNIRWVGGTIEDASGEKEGVDNIPGGSAWSKLR